MQRRKFLAASAVTASSTGFLAGCVGGSQFEVGYVECETTDDGNVMVEAHVENLSGSTQSGTVVAEVTLDSGGTYTSQRSVELIDSEILPVSLTVDPQTSDPPSEDQYQCDASLE